MSLLPRNSNGSANGIISGLLAMMLLMSRTLTAIAVIMTSLPENLIVDCSSPRFRADSFFRQVRAD